eukprot:TRINITY_DN1745_c0_g1_i1.p1 TRINITY_DN1745_c0_g1~~TRINITY_DN1745_c0_g1_i1.p1  ORF type:complete len:554 (-),score=96.23 TRINITY_DN1745_c0_g1_i1:138-1799(-)
MPWGLRQKMLLMRHKIRINTSSLIINLTRHKIIALPLLFVFLIFLSVLWRSGRSMTPSHTLTAKFSILGGFLNRTVKQIPSCPISEPEAVPVVKFSRLKGCGSHIGARFTEDGSLRMDKCAAKSGDPWCQYLTPTRQFLFDINPCEDGTKPLNVEWVTTICNTDVESVAVQVVQKDEALQRAKLKLSDRTRRLAAEAPPKPLDLNFLLIDSLSRAHFFRGLPLTASFLEDLHKGHIPSSRKDGKPEFKIFQFFRYHVVGNNSGPNITPLSSGLSDDEVDDYRTSALGPEADEPAWLWDYASNFGYVSAYIEEQCSNEFAARDWQLHPEAFMFHDESKYGSRSAIYTFDHLLQDVFCHGKFVKWRQYAQSERCIGDAYAHMVTLNYLRSFFSKYPGVGKFAFSLLYEAHESSMKVVRSLDKDLKEFLEDTMLNRTSPPMTVIAADHGMHYGSFTDTKTGWVEHKLPVLFFIVPTWFLDLYPNIEKYLLLNEQRLFTAYDLHYTIKHFVSYPEMPTKQDESRFAYSLIGEEVPIDRTCDEAGIEDNICVCTRRFR